MTEYEYETVAVADMHCGDRLLMRSGSVMVVEEIRIAPGGTYYLCLHLLDAPTVRRKYATSETARFRRA